MSTIILYRNCKILEEKNFEVENVDAYLSTLTSPLTFNNAQYIKQGLDTEVKVRLDQDYLDKQTTNNYNYCKITNDSGDDYYYFIREKVWVAKDCIKLVLRMDTLNTFEYDWDYKLTDKTEISREHKDRWMLTSDKLNRWNGILDIDETITNANWVKSYANGKLTLTYTHQIIDPTEFEISLYFNKIKWNVRSSLFKDVFAVRYNTGLGVRIFNIKADDIAPGYIPATGYIIYTVTIAVPDSDLTKYTTTNATGTVYLDTYATKFLTPVIDTVQEDFGDLSKVIKTNSNIYEDDAHTDRRWYLIYRTPDSPTAASPVDCFLVPNFNYKIGTVGSNTVTLDKDYFAPGFTYYFTYKDNTGGNVTCTANGVTRNLDGGYLTQNRYIAFCVHRRTNGMLNVNAIQYGSNNTVSSYITQVETFGSENEVDSVTFNNVYYMRTNHGETQHDIDVDFDKIQNDYERTIVNDAVGADVYSHTIDDNYFDRTDSRMIKIIELPYAPIDLTDTSKYTIDVTSRTIKLNYQAELINNFKDINLEQYVPYLSQAVTSDQEDPYLQDRFLLDSKLLHSSTTQVKFMYDNYSKEFALENCEYKFIKQLPTEPNSWYLAAYYKQANTITSSLAFKFEAYDFNEKAESDYCDYLISTRNNELPLYHNAYLNYMRTDYNYAKKAQQLQTTNNIVNTAVAGVGGAIAGAQSGGVAGAIVGGVTGTAKGLQNTITSYISSSNAIEQAQLKARMQATGVSGSDDLNLFNFYGNNRLSIRVYQPKDYILEKIDDLYYYCGYKCFKQALPTVVSRVWFNYVQANIVFDEDSTTAKLGNDIKNDIANRWKDGVTFIHKYKDAENVNHWDIDQVKENWEISLFY